MNERLRLTGLPLAALLGLFVWMAAASAGLAAEAAKAKPKVDSPPVSKLTLEAILIWGTNEQSTPEPAHKPVEADILKKLQNLPLKWTNYFEMSRKSVEVTDAAPAKIQVSEKCEVEVKYLGNATIEVAYFGKRQQVVKQALPKGETLLIGGNAPDATAWLVVIRRLE